MFHESLKENKTKADLEGINITDEQLSVQTFGVKPGYICGLGYGPKPCYSTKGKRTRAELERAAFEAEKLAESAEKSTAELKERVKSLEAKQLDFLSMLREEMSSKFDFILQLLGRSRVKHKLFSQTKREEWSDCD